MDGTRYLALFGSEKYDAICNRIRYLTSLNDSITYVFSYCYGKIKVIMLIKLVLNKGKNH